MKLIEKSKVTGDINNGVAWGAEMLEHERGARARETIETRAIRRVSKAMRRAGGVAYKTGQRIGEFAERSRIVH